MAPEAAAGGPGDADVLVLLNRATVVMHSVRTAAHDLSNAFQMVSGSAEMLAGLPDLPPRAATRLDAIQRHVERCHQIVQRLAALARRDPLGARPVDAGQAVARVLEQRRYEHTRSGIAVAVERDETQSWMLRADPQDLDLILLDLVINAEQSLAGRPSPSIRVSLARTADRLAITVADNGSGVPDGTDVFARYLSTRGEGAAGLGLTAARLLAERLGGSLERDATVNDGARFVVELPAG